MKKLSLLLVLCLLGTHFSTFCMESTQSNSNEPKSILKKESTPKEKCPKKVTFAETDSVKVYDLELTEEEYNKKDMMIAMRHYSKGEFQDAQKIFSNLSEGDNNNALRAQAFYFLGEIFYKGHGFEVDIDKAKNYFQKIQELVQDGQYFAGSQMYLGFIHFYNQIDYTKAKTYFEQALQHHNIKEMKQSAQEYITKIDNSSTPVNNENNKKRTREDEVNENSKQKSKKIKKDLDEQAKLDGELLQALLKNNMHLVEQSLAKGANPAVTFRDDAIKKNAEYNLIQRIAIRLYYAQETDKAVRKLLDYAKSHKENLINPSNSTIDDSPLWIAIRNGHYHLVETLLEYGADARTIAKNTNTCLHYAVKMQKNAASVLVELLKNKDCQGLINKRTSTGKTALDYAIEKNDAASIRILLAHKPSSAMEINSRELTRYNFKEVNSLEFAIMRKASKKVVDLLQDYYDKNSDYASINSKNLVEFDQDKNSSYFYNINFTTNQGNSSSSSQNSALKTTVNINKNNKESNIENNNEEVNVVIKKESQSDEQNIKNESKNEISSDEENEEGSENAWFIIRDLNTEEIENNNEVIKEENQTELLSEKERCFLDRQREKIAQIIKKYKISSDTETKLQIKKN